MVDQDTTYVETWVSGTEQPDAAATGEGAQEMAVNESEYRFREQLGAVVTNDYLYEEHVAEDERMIINMGPQHPSTHGVFASATGVGGGDDQAVPSGDRIPAHRHGEDCGDSHLHAGSHQRDPHGLPGTPSQ